MSQDLEALGFAASQDEVGKLCSSEFCRPPLDNPGSHHPPLDNCEYNNYHRLSNENNNNSNDNDKNNVK